MKLTAEDYDPKYLNRPYAHLNGSGPALADRLPSAGFETVEDLADATREDLLAIDRLGEGRADRIMADVSNRVER